MRREAECLYQGSEIPEVGKFASVISTSFTITTPITSTTTVSWQQCQDQGAGGIHQLFFFFNVSRILWSSVLKMQLKTYLDKGEY